MVIFMSFIKLRRYRNNEKFYLKKYNHGHFYVFYKTPKINNEKYYLKKHNHGNFLIVFYKTPKMKNQ